MSGCDSDDDDHDDMNDNGADSKNVYSLLAFMRNHNQGYLKAVCTFFFRSTYIPLQNIVCVMVV